MRDFIEMAKAIVETPIFSVPVLAFIAAYWRPNADGTGNRGWRRFNQATMASLCALGALWVCDAMHWDYHLAMVFAIYAGVMGWEYVRATLQLLVAALIERIKK